MVFEATEAMCKLNNEPAPVTVRVNRQRVTVEEMMERLAEVDVVATRSELSADGLIIESGNVHATAFIDMGLLSIQDESSMIVADALQAGKMERVLDACAAPGGKAMHTAERMDGGTLVALDLHPHKAKLIERQAKRLHIDGVTALALDARQAGTNLNRRASTGFYSTSHVRDSVSSVASLISNGRKTSPPSLDCRKSNVKSLTPSCHCLNEVVR